MAAESLQWRATVSLKSLVAAGAITGIAKKNQRIRLVMTHAPDFPAGMMHVQLSAAVLDDGRFVASASSAPSRIAATVAGFSIATTASPSPRTPRCSSGPSGARAETPFRIPSIDTPGFAAAATAVSVLACYRVVDSADELLKLNR